MNEQKDLLLDWYIENVFGGVVVIGKIYKDSKHRFKDGTEIHTSLVKSIDFEIGVVKTLNSTYYLG